jgi:hypothetical protein
MFALSNRGLEYKPKAIVMTTQYRFVSGRFVPVMTQQTANYVDILPGKFKIQSLSLSETNWRKCIQDKQQRGWIYIPSAFNRTSIGSYIVNPILIHQHTDTSNVSRSHLLLKNKAKYNNNSHFICLKWYSGVFLEKKKSRLLPAEYNTGRNATVYYRNTSEGKATTMLTSPPPP